MSIQIHGTPSFSRKSKRGQLAAAQVTVIVGEGSARRSLTRHIKLVNGDWFGLNPDERAIPLNARYEAELVEAKANWASAYSALEGLEKKLSEEEGLTEEEKLRIYSVADGAEKIQESLRKAIETAETKLASATIAANDAETKINIVRRELPLEVEFVGPGLTN